MRIIIAKLEADRKFLGDDTTEEWWVLENARLRALVVVLWNGLRAAVDSDLDLEKPDGFPACRNCGEIGHSAETCTHE